MNCHLGLTGLTDRMCCRTDFLLQQHVLSYGMTVLLLIATLLSIIELMALTNNARKTI